MQTIMEEINNRIEDLNRENNGTEIACFSQNFSLIEQFSKKIKRFLSRLFDILEYTRFRNSTLQ